MTKYRKNTVMEVQRFKALYGKRFAHRGLYLLKSNYEAEPSWFTASCAAA
jgi:hypothetical protein